MLGPQIKIKEKTILAALIATAILLFISIVLLLFPHGEKNATSSSEGNVIGGQVNTVIELENDGTAEKLRFSVENMFPGDSESKSFHIALKNADGKYLNFRTTVASGSNILSEALSITVNIDTMATPLYEGYIKDMPSIIQTIIEDNTDNVKYDITVHLSTSAGNEYQNEELFLDFEWWIDENDYNDEPPLYIDEQPAIDEGCCAWCFGICPWCWILLLFLVVAFVAVVLVGIIWFLKQKRKK